MENCLLTGMGGIMLRGPSPVVDACGQKKSSVYDPPKVL